MKKLTIEDVVGYLPFELNGKEIDSSSYTARLMGIISDTEIKVSLPRFPYSETMPLRYFKPILHPLSDLTKYCEDLGFVPIEEIKKRMLVDFDYKDSDGIKSLATPRGNNLIIAIHNEIADECPIGIYNNLLKWHFDIHNLIPDGLAIDYNTLNPKK